MTEPRETRRTAALLEDGSANVELVGLRLEDEAGLLVGRIEWRADDGEVVDLLVAEAHRRQGVATRLWRLAEARGARHSEWRTIDGQRWALSLGDPLPAWRVA